MPFWKRDPELQAARAEAEASLPPGWKIYRSDSERFRVPAGHITTYGICATGPSDQHSLVIAVGEANAYRHFARHMRGGLDFADGWAIPLTNIRPAKPAAIFALGDEDPDVLAAKQELDQSLPQGWEPYDIDRERYFFPGGYLETYAVAARGPGDEAALVMGVGKAGGLRTLAKRLRGELEIADAWAAPMDTFTPR